MNIKNDPYVVWLLETSDRDPKKLEELLVNEFYFKKNEHVTDLLDLVGDSIITYKTFQSLTNLLLE